MARGSEFLAMAKEYQAGEAIFLTGSESEMSKIKQIVTDLAHSKY